MEIQQSSSTSSSYYTQQCVFKLIPYECVLHIFGFLKVQDIVHVSLVCKEWHVATKDRTLSPAIRLLAGTPHFVMFKNAGPSNQCSCNHLLVRQIDTPERTNYQIVGGLDYLIVDNFGQEIHQIVGNFALEMHWRNFYDICKKQQKTMDIVPGSGIYADPRCRFTCFFQKNLIKVDETDSYRSELNLSLYELDEEGKPEFKEKICDIDYKTLFACDPLEKYFAISTGHADKIKIYKGNGIEIGGIDRPTELQKYSKCTAMCFAGNRLVAGLTVLPLFQSALSSLHGLPSAPSTYRDFDPQNPHFHHIQIFDPETGELVISKPQLDRPVQMAGDENTLVLVSPNPAIKVYETFVLDPLTLDKKFKLEIENHPFGPFDYLMVRGDKIIVGTQHDSVEIFNAFSGNSIKKWRGKCFDVAVEGNYAAIGSSSPYSMDGNAIEIWDLETGELIKKFATNQYEPKKIQFHIGDGKLDKTAYLIVALSNGEVYTWAL